MLEFLKRKRFIIIATILITLIGVVYSYVFVNERYKSYTRLILGGNNISVSEIKDINQIFQTETLTSSDQISTYNQIIKSNSFIQEIKNILKIDINENDYRNSVDLKKISKTNIIQITARNENSNLASKMANEIAVLLSDKLAEIYSINSVYIVEWANESENPYNINHARDIGLAFIIGLFLSNAYGILVSKLDTRIKNIADVETETGVKILATIPNGKRKKKNRLEDFENEEITDIRTKEAFEVLKTNMQFSNVKKKENKVMLITSCFSSEGKSYVAANLAVTFAKSGKKVVLIDSDMRKERQSKIFSLPNNIGFSNYLSNLDRSGMEINPKINEIIKETGIKNLNIITSGSIPPNPSELLTSDKLTKLIKDLSGFYDLIILDGAPVLPETDSLILSRIANSTLLVSLYKRTKKEEIAKARKDIENVGGRVLGTALNGVRAKRKVKIKEKVKIEKENKKFYIINLKTKFVEFIKSIKEQKDKSIKLLTDGKEEIKLAQVERKIKRKEKEKIEHEEKLKQASIARQKKIMEIEERAKLARLKEEEKIRNKEIKRLEEEKKKKIKEEKRQNNILKKQKRKEEARIQEELMDDNLYPKTKYNKSLFE